MTKHYQPATKFSKPMKVLAYGPTHSGKTYSLLELAVGIVMTMRGYTDSQKAYQHIVLIDTEYGRGALYGKVLGPYNYIRIDKPYNTDKLVKEINMLNNDPDIDVIIPDSLTHFWVKEGGILDEKNAKDKQGGNSYTNWADSTAKFNRMVDVIMQSPKHILCTARSKNDTALVENDKGKMAPRTYGLTPELRDNITYEFDIVFNVDKATHNMIVEKGVPGMDPVYELGTVSVGQQGYDLFIADAVVKERTEADIAESIRTLAKNNNLITFIQLALSGRKLEDLTRNEILKLEADALAEVKKRQINKAK